MAKAHNGFVSDSGVQSHSAGDHFPYSVVCVGGFPAEGNSAHAEVWGPEGRRDGPFDTHAEAEEWATWLKKLGDAADFVSGVRK